MAKLNNIKAIEQYCKIHGTHRGGTPEFYRQFEDMLNYLMPGEEILVPFCGAKSMTADPTAHALTNKRFLYLKKGFLSKEWCSIPIKSIESFETDSIEGRIGAGTVFVVTSDDMYETLINKLRARVVTELLNDALGKIK